MDQLIEYAPLLAKGAGVTISLALLSFALATLLGALGAAARITGGFVLRSVVKAYTGIVRGIPDLVLIFLIYYGGQRLVNLTIRALDMDRIEVSAYFAGVVAIGFIYGAYLTETFRGAYLSVPRGQEDAAKALGLRPLVRLRFVVLPQLARFALPGYGNVWQVLIKSTAVVSVIGLEDLVGLAGDVGSSLRQPFTYYMLVLLVYLGFTAISTALFNYAEERANRSYTDAH